jgi:hypothetical protein
MKRIVANCLACLHEHVLDPATRLCVFCTHGKVACQK